MRITDPKSQEGYRHHVTLNGVKVRMATAADEELKQVVFLVANPIKGTDTYEDDCKELYHWLFEQDAMVVGTAPDYPDPFWPPKYLRLVMSGDVTLVPDED